jgi:hypothetical protein
MDESSAGAACLLMISLITLRSIHLPKSTASVIIHILASHKKRSCQAYTTWSLFQRIGLIFREVLLFNGVTKMLFVSHQIAPENQHTHEISEAFFPLGGVLRGEHLFSQFPRNKSTQSVCCVLHELAVRSSLIFLGVFDA